MNVAKFAIMIPASMMMYMVQTHKQNVPMMIPNSPSADAKISITSTLTNSVEFWASDNAALLPTTPTDNLGDAEVGKNQGCDNIIVPMITPTCNSTSTAHCNNNNNNTATITAPQQQQHRGNNITTIAPQQQ